MVTNCRLRPQAELLFVGVHNTTAMCRVFILLDGETIVDVDATFLGRMVDATIVTDWGTVHRIDILGVLQIEVCFPIVIYLVDFQTPANGVLLLD